MSRLPETDLADESTQPFSSPGPSFQYQPSNADAPPPRDSCRGVDIGNDNVTISAEGGKQTEASEVNIFCLKNTVAWRDVNDQARRSGNISLNVYSDASTNTAFFKLYCDSRFKGSIIETIYLFIQPETIRSVTLEPNLDSPAPSSLQFSLTQPPSLIVPRDRIEQCKKQAKGPLGSMRSLAEITRFTIQFINSSKTVSILSPLGRVIQLFSLPTGRPLTNTAYASVTSLYGGRGGIVVNSKATATGPRGPRETEEVDGANLPRYTASTSDQASHKRPRKESGRGGIIVNSAAAVAGPRSPHETEEADGASLPDYTASTSGQSSHKRPRTDSSPSGPRSPAPHERMLFLLESMCTSISRLEGRLDRMEGRLDRMEGRLGTMEGQLGTMEGRLDGMEVRFPQWDGRFDGMESRFEELESNVLDAVQSSYSPCRFNTEERTEIFEEIHEQFEDRTVAMKIDCEEMLKEVEEDAGKAIEELQEEIREEVRETLEQLEESVEENTERLVKQGLRTKLENASLRFDGTVFLDT